MIVNFIPGHFHSSFGWRLGMTQNIKEENELQKEEDLACQSPEGLPPRARCLSGWERITCLCWWPPQLRPFSSHYPKAPVLDLSLIIPQGLRKQYHLCHHFHHHCTLFLGVGSSSRSCQWSPHDTRFEGRHCKIFSDFLPSVHGSHEDEAVNKYHTTEMFVSGVLGHSDVPERVLRRMGPAGLAREASPQLLWRVILLHHLEPSHKVCLSLCLHGPPVISEWNSHAQGLRFQRCLPCDLRKVTCLSESWLLCPVKPKIALSFLRELLLSMTLVVVKSLVG